MGKGGGGLLDNALKNTTNTGSPLHSEKLKMAEKIPCLGKHREFGNVAKTQIILCA